jgi:hypothetical protein
MLHQAVRSAEMGSGSPPPPPPGPMEVQKSKCHLEEHTADAKVRKQLAQTAQALSTCLQPLWLFCYFSLVTARKTKRGHVDAHTVGRSLPIRVQLDIRVGPCLYSDSGLLRYCLYWLSLRCGSFLTIVCAVLFSNSVATFTSSTLLCTICSR